PSREMSYRGSCEMLSFSVARDLPWPAGVWAQQPNSEPVLLPPNDPFTSHPHSWSPLGRLVFQQSGRARLALIGTNPETFLSRSLPHGCDRSADSGSYLALAKP